MCLIVFAVRTAGLLERFCGSGKGLFFFFTLCYNKYMGDPATKMHFLRLKQGEIKTKYEDPRCGTEKSFL